MPEEWPREGTKRPGPSTGPLPSVHGRPLTGRRHPPLEPQPQRRPLTEALPVRVLVGGDARVVDRPHAGLGLLDQVKVRRHRLVPLEVQVEEGRYEVLRDVVHADGVPHEIGVMREGPGVPRLARRGDGGRRVVARVLEGEQVTFSVHGAFEDGARALLVTRHVIGAAGHEHDGRLDARQPVLVPEARRHPPRRDRDRRLDPGIQARLVGVRARLPFRQEPVGRRENPSPVAASVKPPPMTLTRPYPPIE